MLLAGILFVCLLPGALIVGALFPAKDSLSWIERLGLSILLSWANVTVVGLLLCALHQFNAPTLWIGLLVTTVLAGAVSFKRRTVWTRIAAAAFQSFRSWKGFFAALVVALCLLPTTYLLLSPLANHAYSFYYYGQAVALVEEQGIPAQVIEYNTPMATITNKIAHNLITASVILTGGLDTRDFDTVQFVIATATRLLAVCGLWAFARRHFAPLLATFFTITVLWLPQMTSRMSAYRAEGTSIALLFLTLACFERAFTEPKDKRWALLAAVSLSMTALVHGVSGLVGVLWYAALAASYLAAERRQFFARVPGMALTAALTGLFVLVPLMTIGSGEITNQEVLAGESIDIELPFGVTDPTDVLRSLVNGTPLRSGNRPYAPLQPQDILQRWSEDVLEFLRQLQIIPVIAAVLMLVSVIVGWRLKSQRPDIAAALLFFALILGLGFFFMALGNAQQLRILAIHGVNREFPYMEMFSVLLFAFGINSLWNMEMPKQAAFRLFRSPRVIYVALTLLLVGCAALLIIKNFEPERAEMLDTSFSPDAQQAMAWLAENTPPDAVVALNARTSGVVSIFAQRIAWTEGRGPYFQRRNLAHALRALLGFREFFECPSSAALARLPADYLVVTTSQNAFGILLTRGDPGQIVANLRAFPGTVERVSFGDVYIFETVDVPDQPTPACPDLSNPDAT